MQQQESTNLFLFFIVVLWVMVASAQAQLSTDFYTHSCPNVDTIVHTTVSALVTQSNVVAPSTLRLFAHDCFVEGCDASVLITSTSNNTAERDSSENNIPQAAFDTINQAKKAVEATCPGIVSCADILVMAARDVVTLSGGPHWEVLKGRRDGLISQSTRVPGHLPGSNFNVTQLKDNFAAVNLSLSEMVILSGAHTIGFSHCSQFRDRLYGQGIFTRADASINASYVAQLKATCPEGETGPGKFQAFDDTSAFVFDNSYYKNLQLGQGLLFADEVLFTDNSTRPLVDEFASSQDSFFTSFITAMNKMSTIGVKTQPQNGEIRINCTAFNTPSANIRPGANIPSPSPAQAPNVPPSPAPSPSSKIPPPAANVPSPSPSPSSNIPLASPPQNILSPPPQNIPPQSSFVSPAASPNPSRKIL